MIVFPGVTLDWFWGPEKGGYDLVSGRMGVGRGAESPAARVGETKHTNTLEKNQAYRFDRGLHPPLLLKIWRDKMAREKDGVSVDGGVFAWPKKRPENKAGRALILTKANPLAHPQFASVEASSFRCLPPA